MSAQACALMEVLELPDVTAMLEVKNMDTATKVEFVAMMGPAIARVMARVDEALAPARQAVAEARGDIQADIKKSGGTVLPHDTFDVRIVQNDKPDKRIDILRTLVDLLPSDQFRKAVFIKTIEVKNVDPKLLEPIIAAGGKPEWDADMTKLNKHAKDFGPEHEISKIIAEGAPRVTTGAPQLVITPRESAIRSVN
jgi:hypothetical protein